MRPPTQSQTIKLGRAGLIAQSEVDRVELAGRPPVFQRTSAQEVIRGIQAAAIGAHDDAPYVLHHLLLRPKQVVEDAFALHAVHVDEGADTWRIVSGE